MNHNDVFITDAVLWCSEISHYCTQLATGAIISERDNSLLARDCRRTGSWFNCSVLASSYP
jgi:hypothetical protein